MLKLSDINSSVLFCSRKNMEEKKLVFLVKNYIYFFLLYIVKNYKENLTFVPLGLSITNTSFQTCMPVVSLSQPPLHVKPVNGSLLPPIQL